jgi:truncated hemoglobin YjbI
VLVISAAQLLPGHVAQVDRNDAPDTMFECYGLAVRSRFVLRFYDRVLASSALAPFFADTDMQRRVD